MNFINVNPVQVGNTPTSNANFIGVVYSNVLKSSLSYYLPLVGGVLSSNLSIGNSTNNSNTLNVHSFINVASNITVCSNVITSNINSINQNNSGLITTSSLISGDTTLTNTITQTNKRLITLKGLISIESNISFNLNLDTLSPPIANASLMGGSGSRIIFKNAKNISAYPDAIGLDTDILWMSSSNISIFINGENKVNINSNGVLTTSNQINQINQNVNNFFMGKVGIATAVSSDYNLNVNGSINASSITINGSSISGSISDVITNNSNFTSGTGFNTSNYARNISNILKANIDTNLANNSNFTSGTGFNTSNYTTNISNVLKANIDTNLANNSNFTSGTGFNTSNYATNISNILKANIDTKEAILTFSNPLTRNTNTISINLSSYSTTGNDTNYLLKTGGAMTGQITGITTLNATSVISSTLSTTNNASILGPTKGINGSTGDRLVLWVGDANTYPYSLGINGSTLWYSVPSGSSHKFYVNGSLITTISSTGLSTTGTISGTTFSGSGSSLTDIPFSALTGTSPYVLKAGDTMTGQLIFTTTTGNNPIRIYSTSTAANNCIQFQNDNSMIVYLGLGGSTIAGTNYKNNFFIQSTNGIILNVNRASDSTPNFIINNSGNIGIGTTNPVNILQVGDGGKLRIANGITDYSLLGSKDVDDYTNTRIVVSANGRGSGYAGCIEYVSTSNGDHIFYATSNIRNDIKMIIKNSGNVGIGTTTPNRNFEVYGTNPALVIRAAGEYETSTLFLGTAGVMGAYKCAIIAEGYTGWSRSRLHFCLNNTGDPYGTNWNEYPTYNATIADAKMTILPSGNVGIGTNNPLSKLHIFEATGTTAGPNNGSIIIDHDNSGGASSITFRSKFNKGSDYGYIQYQDDSTIGGTSECSKLIIGTQNDVSGNISDDILLLPSGGVAINTTTTSGYRLYVNGTTYLNGDVTVNGILTLLKNTWILSSDNVARIYFEDNSTTYFHSGSANTPFIFRNFAQGDIFSIDNSGNVSSTGSLSISGTITNGANSYINAGGLRLGGWDGITLYNYARDIGIYCDNGRNINIGFWGGNTILSMNNSGLTITGNVGIGITNPNLNLQVGSTNANHNIGRAILTAGNIHNADKRDFLSIGRWDGSTTADWEFTGLKYGVITGAASGETNDNHSCITFHTWGNSISGSREVARINSRGLLTTSNIDCGGGIAINGSTAFFNTAGVDAGNLTNTYINFKGAGAGSDWCYLRQIGGNEAYKLAFDFQDDQDARFCIRACTPNYTSITATDIIDEVFTVDTGNVTCIGNVTTKNTRLSAPVKAKRGSYGDRFILYEGVDSTTEPYSLGITTNTLWYSVPSLATHTWYIGGATKMTLNSSGEVTATKFLGSLQGMADTATALTAGDKTISGKLTISGELVNQYWKFTNETDYCRLYNKDGTSYFNFAAQELYASTSLTVLTTASIGGNCTAPIFIGRLQGKADTAGTADSANALNSGNDYTVNTINANGDLLYKGHRQPLTIRYYLVSNGVDNSGYYINYKGYSNVYIKIMILGRYGEYSATNIPTNVPYAPSNVLNIANIEWYLWYFTPDSVGGQTKFWYGRMAAGTKIYIEEMWY